MDVREFRLPNRLTVAMLVAALVTATVVALSDDSGTAARGLIAGAIATGMMFVAMMIRPTAVGWGDVKLAPSLGCYLGLAGGWDTVYFGLFLWWFLIAVGAALGLVTGVLRRDDPMPYGPAMLLGTFVAVLMA